eukprot:m.167013 g.167013  ORF g.167013 m.167013 type:complete len:75 (+) comp14719_c0_seq1:2573-2797(+)
MSWVAYSGMSLRCPTPTFVISRPILTVTSPETKGLASIVESCTFLLVDKMTSESPGYFRQRFCLIGFERATQIG